LVDHVLEGIAEDGVFFGFEVKPAREGLGLDRPILGVSDEVQDAFV
jgi:hypothetical protein